MTDTSGIPDEVVERACERQYKGWESAELWYKYQLGCIMRSTLEAVLPDLQQPLKEKIVQLDALVRDLMNENQSLLAQNEELRERGGELKRMVDGRDWTIEIKNDEINRLHRYAMHRQASSEGPACEAEYGGKCDCGLDRGA
jgi:regulator of replication initiation timing